MIEFPTHKIILEVGEDMENCLKKIEVSFDSQIGLYDLLNQVIRPILLGLTYTNDSISNVFHMNEFGEEFETPDFADGLLDPEQTISGTESVNLKKKIKEKNKMYDTDEI
jgi:hypothetical protein